MKVAILGTGNVGQTISEKLISLGHDVMLGTRNVADTLVRAATDNYGSLPFGEWHAKNPKVQLGTFAESAAFGEMVITALNGAATLTAIDSCDSADFDNKIIIDIANPLDFSKGFPPTLIESLCNSNSLGEEIQKALPNAKVVKTLNSMWSGLMVNPMMLNEGNHTNYICGNDADAKAKVIALLNTFGWKAESILDLGDITNSRGTESTLLLWTRIYGATQSGAFNTNIVKL
jgi:8-hydroxy-5-deazaflavin:NADPH oxidoreductase